MKINNFRGDRPDISAKKEALVMRCLAVTAVKAAVEFMPRPQFCFVSVSAANSCLYTVGPLLIESLWMGKDRVHRGARGSQRSVAGPNEDLKERLSSCRVYLQAVAFFVLMSSTNGEKKTVIVVIQYQRNSIITGPTVYRSVGINRRHD